MATPKLVPGLWQAAWVAASRPGAPAPGGASSVNSLTGLHHGQAGRSIDANGRDMAEGWRPLVRLPYSRRIPTHFYRCGKVLIDQKNLGQYQGMLYKQGLVVGFFTYLHAWAVIHAKSGIAVTIPTYDMTLDDTILLAESILPLYDWVKPFCSWAMNPELDGQIKFRTKMIGTNNENAYRMD